MSAISPEPETQSKPSGQQQQQQQQQQTVVIVNQPNSAKACQPQNVREWSTGLCGCFEGCGSCVYAFFCYPCFMCTLASRMNECMCGPFFCDKVFVIAMRTKLRSMHGISGSILNDCFTVTCCEFCATQQMYRELNNVERPSS
jgi:Cys-rich protein (TIGR01571 family)